MSMMGGAGWAAYRSFIRDSSVSRRQLQPGTLRRIGGYARPYAKQILGLLTLVGLGAGAAVASPLLLKAIIDRGVMPGSPASRPSLITWLALGVAALALLEAGLTLIQRWFSVRIGEGLIFDLRTRAFAHVQRMPVAFFTRTQTGSVTSRLTNDVIAAQRALTTTLSAVFSNVVTLVIVLVAMMLLSWQITLVVLALLPGFILPAKWVGRRLQVITRESMQLDAGMSTTMTERFNVGGSTLVKLYGRLDEESRAFADQARRVRDIGVTQAMYSRVFFAGLTLMASLATALVYGIGGHLVLGGAFGVGTLVALGTLLTRLYGPLTSLSNVHVDIMAALVSFDRVFELLDLRPAIEEKPGAVTLPRGPAEVEFDRVSFCYPRADEVSLPSLEAEPEFDGVPTEQVLHDISFTARPGRLVAVVGPSGAGKTTVTHLVSRLYDVSGGAVRIGGYDVRDVTVESLREAVGVVTQEPHLFHETIRANLRYARPSATDEEILRACAGAQIHDLVTSLPEGLDTLVGERGHRLSGGQKQRLALARLLLKSPSVVVLDEAMSHLDSESEQAVQRALWSALAGCTALVVAHRLSTVQEADLILVVAGGRIVQRGRHEDLLAQEGLYAELYRRQFSRETRSSVTDGRADGSGVRV